MADLYDAIKTKFDASTTLGGASGAFTELFAGEIESPADVSVPYCTVVSSEESEGERGFDGWEWVTEEFTFVVVESTLELARDRVELVNAVYDDDTLSLSAAGIKDIRLWKGGQTRAELAEDRWSEEIVYMARYWRKRP